MSRVIAVAPFDLGCCWFSAVAPTGDLLLRPVRPAAKIQVES
jgi:hypothetical protein